MSRGAHPCCQRLLTDPTPIGPIVMLGHIWQSSRAIFPTMKVVAVVCVAGRHARVQKAAASVACVLLVVSSSARADNDDPRPSTSQKPQLRSPRENAARAIGLDEIEGPTILEGIKALNPIDAARDDLRDIYGFYLHGIYLGDPYANLGGGLRRGATYSGRLDVELDVDTRKAVGIEGGTFHANMFQIHGSDLSAKDIGNVLSVDDIAALPSTRLYELWYEQRFGDKVALRVGQQGIDVEFLTSNYAANFINATFGWPGLPTLDLPDGGPAYPLATPAARLKIDPTANLSILAAVFDGVPAGPCARDPQTCDPSGLNFRVSDPPLVFLEMQYRYNRDKDANDQNAAGLPGTLKIGAFAHFGPFDDQRFAGNGFPLASTSGLGTPATHSPNGGVYGIVDQQIYRLPGDDAEKGIGVFVRAIGAPSDRNPIDLYLDAGVSALGLVPGRSNDLFGMAAAFAKASETAIAADDDVNAATGLAAPVRNFEAVIEVTYQAEVIPGFAIQPTFQYIAHPGTHISDPYGTGLQAIPDAKVFGAATTVRF